MCQRLIAASLVLSASVGLLLWTPPVGAAAATAAAVPKADPNAKGEPLKVTVVSASGPAQKLQAGNGQEKWEPIKAGDTLDEFTVIRTGLRASLVLRFADRGEFTINGATKMGIGEFRKQGNTVKAEVGIKYGSVRASVDASKGANDFKVTTPVATLSVLGSSSDLGFAGDSGLQINASSGNWHMDTPGGSRNVGAGESGNSNLVRSIDLNHQGRSVQVADAFGLTSQETHMLQNQGSGRGNFNVTGGSQNTTGPSRPVVEPTSLQTGGTTGTTTGVTPSLPEGEPGYP